MQENKPLYCSNTLAIKIRYLMKYFTINSTLKVYDPNYHNYKILYFFVMFHVKHNIRSKRFIN